MVYPSSNGSNPTPPKESLISQIRAWVVFGIAVVGFALWAYDAATGRTKEPPPPFPELPANATVVVKTDARGQAVEMKMAPNSP